MFRPIRGSGGNHGCITAKSLTSSYRGTLPVDMYTYEVWVKSVQQLEGKTSPPIGGRGSHLGCPIGMENESLKVIELSKLKLSGERIWTDGLTEGIK